MSDPVGLDTSYTHEADGVGEGFAPYFIGLALYVGSLVMWMMLRPISNRSLAAPVPDVSVVMNNLKPAILLGVAQSLMLTAVLKLGLHLETGHLVAFVLFAMLVSAGFVTLLQTLNIWFGTAVGRLLTLVLLMLQLTSAGGTYPIQTTPGFFQALHSFLPMTQVVNGFRQAITGDLNHLFWIAVLYLLGMIVGALLLSVWGASRKRVWTISRLHPAITL